MAVAAAFVFAGAAAAQPDTGPFPTEFALSSLLPANGGNGADGFVIYGIDAGDRSGQSVAAAGDINGDGIDDFVIGAELADPEGRSGAGETYVIFGAVGLGIGGAIELSSLNGANGFVLFGVRGSEASGCSVSSAGDVNGDGIVDLIIGAYRGARPGSAITGSCYVLFGATDIGAGGVVNLSTLNGRNGFAVYGVDPNDECGRAVSCAGDVNGDGYDDLIIGASKASFIQGQLDAGRTDIFSNGESYILFGDPNIGENGSILLASLDGVTGFKIRGIGIDEHSGSAVSAAGDVNADGFDDVIIGADGAVGYGVRGGGGYILYGGSDIGAGGLLNLSELDGLNGYSFHGVGVLDRCGRSVCSLGDFNGDGVDDYLVGAAEANANGLGNSGEGYVVFGHSDGVGGSSLSLASLNGSNGFTLRGVASGDWAGQSVAGLGDVNSDGSPDLIIGAHWADPYGNSRAGESYVMFGGIGTGASGVVELSEINGANGFVLKGAGVGSQSGASVALAGDTNGDGIADLLIGAPFASPHGKSAAGESYVVFGRRRSNPAQCMGNANGDEIVDAADIAEVIANWLSNYAPGAGPGDANNDGVVDFNDINAVIANWLASCP